MSIPLSYVDCLRRCQRALLQEGLALTAIDSMPGKEPVLFQSELKDRGKVKIIPDLLALARSLELVTDEEVPAGAWAAQRELTR